MFCLVSAVLFSLLINASIEQQIRTWIPNTNFDNRRNWLNNFIPCESTTAVFPRDLYAGVYMPKNTKVKDIVLPDNGELLLRPDSEIDITGVKFSPTCNQTESIFKNINIEPWFKPANWKSAIENNAVPHTERVPCMYDDVVFPNDMSFWVEYPTVPISVNSFTIDGKNITNNELQRFLLSEPGTRQFKNADYQTRTDVITIKNQQCTDKSGCSCHKYNSYVQDSVCSYVKRLCSVAHCLNPVKAHGHCCEFCGAYLELKIAEDFELSVFKEQVYHFVDNTVLNVHISKGLTIFSDVIQVVIREKSDYKEYSTSAARNLHEKILDNLKSFKISHSTLYISGPEYWPEVQLKTTVAIVLGTLAAVLMCLLAIYIIYGPLQEKQMPFKLPFSMNTFHPFIFVRFENSGDTDGGLEFRNRSVASSLFNLDQAFDNPLYGEPLPSTSETAVEIKTETAEKLEFKNPLFSELMKQESTDIEE